MSISRCFRACLGALLLSGHLLSNACTGHPDPGDDADPTSNDDVDVGPAESAYGIFQLYGDEYQAFRAQMGFSLEDYWAFVDEHVARLGVRFTRTNTLLIWGIIEPVLGGGYVWENRMRTDEVIQAVYAPAEGKEMDILLVIEPGRGGPSDPIEMTGVESEYQAFVRAVVERYGGAGQGNVLAAGRVRHWQVMNEPVLDLDAGRLTVEQYAEIVQLTAAAIHDVDPEAKLVLGEVGSHQPEVLQLIRDVDLAAVNVHFWSIRDDYQHPMLETMRRAMDENGLPDVEIWMCEFGTYTNQPAPWMPAHTDACQARWLVKAMVSNRAAGARRILWNNLVAWTDFAGDPESMYNFMGLISSGEDSGDDASDLGRERPAYFAFQRLIETTDTRTSEMLGEVQGLPALARAFAFAPKDESPTIHVAWSDGEPVMVDLPCPLGSARVTNMVPGEAGVFEEVVLSASAGLVSLELDADPVLVEPID